MKHERRFEATPAPGADAPSTRDAALERLFVGLYGSGAVPLRR